METTRLSLDQFKAKAEISNQAEELEKISGGILGACHCECCPNWVPDWFCHLLSNGRTHEACH